MKQKDIETTDLWELYQKGVNYNQIWNVYSDVDTNNRFYNGDQWEGLQTSGIEKIQLNFIQPIVKYKVGKINQNLFAINYSSANYDDKEFLEEAEEYCKMLNKQAAIIMEKDNLDYKIRKITKKGAIVSEGIIHAYYDEETKLPKNEILNKTDICYGDENNENIQEQPYIIIKTRRPLSFVEKLAIDLELSEDEINKIVTDNNTENETGDYAKQEVNDKVTVITKLYKKDGKVYYDTATKFVELEKEQNTGYTNYPLTHFIWESVDGYARGVSEVKYLIPNQKELNKTLMRRAISIKQIAYPQKIVNLDHVVNPGDAGKVGSVIKVKGLAVTDVRQAFGSTTTANVSTDAEKLQAELITTTRELRGAGEVATGEINPETASGKAILAVQQASEEPLNEQLSNLKSFLEGLAKIWFEIIRTHKGKIKIVTKEEDIYKNTIFVEKEIPKKVIDKLKISVKIDITPKGAFDKYAQELSLENLLKNGQISFEEYTNSLEDDSVMPKQKLIKIIENRKEKEKVIQDINMQGIESQNQASTMMNAQEDVFNQVAV